MKKSITSLLVICMILVLTGCAEKTDYSEVIIGTWAGNTEKDSPTGEKYITYEFYKGGTGKINTEYIEKKEYSASSSSFTWVITEDHLVLVSYKARSLNRVDVLYIDVDNDCLKRNGMDTFIRK